MAVLPHSRGLTLNRVSSLGLGATSRLHWVLLVFKAELKATALCGFPGTLVPQCFCLPISEVSLTFGSWLSPSRVIFSPSGCGQRIGAAGRYVVLMQGWGRGSSVSGPCTPVGLTSEAGASGL